jgi:hypothetical protein
VVEWCQHVSNFVPHIRGPDRLYAPLYQDLVDLLLREDEQPRSVPFSVHLQIIRSRGIRPLYDLAAHLYHLADSYADTNNELVKVAREFAARRPQQHVPCSVCGV